MSNAIDCTPGTILVHSTDNVAKLEKSTTTLENQLMLESKIKNGLEKSLYGQLKNQVAHALGSNGRNKNMKVNLDLN